MSAASALLPPARGPPRGDAPGEEGQSGNPAKAHSEPSCMSAASALLPPTRGPPRGDAPGEEGQSGHSAKAHFEAGLAGRLRKGSEGGSLRELPCASAPACGPD